MSQNLILNLTDGSVSFPCSPDTAQALQAELLMLWGRLKTIAAHTNPSEGQVPTKPNPQPSLEYRQVGEVFLEVFCNPNIWPTPFAAKVLLTVRDDRIRVTTEVALNQMMEDINIFLNP